MKITLGAVSMPGTSRQNKTGTWRVYKPVWLHDKCIGCNFCIIFCPEGCVSGEGKGASSTYDANMDYCKGCGICANECPVNDIEMIMEVR